MANIGTRIREERDRLKLTQEAFANACGVSRRAQVTYEADERSPDARYLEAASKFWVDIAYVIQGVRADDFAEKKRLLIIEDLFYFICSEIGFDDARVRGFINGAIPIITEGFGEEKISGYWASDLMEAMKEFFDKPRDKPLSTDLLVAVIEQIEVALMQKNKSLPTNKKALIISMLYQAGELSGVVDKNILDNFIALAVA